MTTAEQLQQLAAACPGAGWKQVGDGSHVITIPDVELPEGWNAKKTTVRFLAPVGYPVSKPDCFWADPTLRLNSGAIPANTGQNHLPDGSSPQLWFSWHVQRWSPNFDTLLTYFRTIKNRFREVR
jgi:Prokaryotic E2 family E